MIARSISKCEFKTKLGGVQVKQSDYYRWNVEPNKNQSSSAFIQQWITTLFMENECLIVQADDGDLLIADSFVKKDYALYDCAFSQVTVGDYLFQKTFRQSDVLYFKLCRQDVNKLLKRMYESYGKLIAYGQKSYQKSRGTKGTLTVPTATAGTPEQAENINDYLSGNVRKFLESDNGVLPVYHGYEYKDLGSKTYANDSTRDIRAMIDDVLDFTARSFGIPPTLLRGDIVGTKDAIDSYLTFCIDPLCDMIQEEINRKLYKKSGVLSGSGVHIDTKAIKHVDLLSVSSAIDKLIGSGAFCVNDIRTLVGEEAIDEPWARQHWMTKNYATADELLNIIDEMKGGNI